MRRGSLEERVSLDRAIPPSEQRAGARFAPPNRAARPPARAPRGRGRRRRRPRLRDSGADPRLGTRPARLGARRVRRAGRAAARLPRAPPGGARPAEARAEPGAPLQRSRPRARGARGPGRRLDPFLERERDLPPHLLLLRVQPLRPRRGAPRRDPVDRAPPSGSRADLLLPASRGARGRLRRALALLRHLPATRVLRDPRGAPGPLPAPRLERERGRDGPRADRRAPGLGRGRDRRAALGGRVRGPRATVARRLLLCLCGLAASSTALALGLQQRALAADLERAASLRLERAAAAAERLIEGHLATLSERYAAISNTPELRANLEVKHAPTLSFHATRLAAQQRAALLLFTDRAGRVSALAGDGALAAPARKALARGGRALLAHSGRLFAAAEVPLATRGRPVGKLVAVEPLDEEILAGWSELCGARVAAAPTGDGGTHGLDRVLRRLGDVELRVTASLEEERRALRNSRRNQLTAGAVALALAFGASVLLAQGLVRPIRRIQDATERIAR